MAELKPNSLYHHRYVTSSVDQWLTDPFGEKFMVYQGQQFKYRAYQLVEDGCSSCSKKTRWVYLIDSYAHCEEGTYLWPEGNTGKAIYVSSDLFEESENLIWPPVTEDFPTSVSGVHTEQFVPPHLREIPRKGGTWYIDPWHSEKDG